MNKPTFKELYYLCVQKLTNFPYIEEDFDALTNYELLCKVVEELNKMITNMNTQNESIIALYNAFNELKTYVDTYFDNLDVQEEINNKLDEMAESGELTNLIKNYVDPIYQAYEEEINNSINVIKNEVEAIANGSPLPASSISDMTDTTRLYVLLTDGYVYYYNGTTWVQGWIYQASVNDKILSETSTNAVENRAITKELLNNIELTRFNYKILNFDDWKKGTLNLTTGEESGQSDSTLINSTFHRIDTESVFNILNSGYKFRGVIYNEDGSYNSYFNWINENSYPPLLQNKLGKYLKLELKKIDGSTFSDSDYPINNNLHLRYDNYLNNNELFKNLLPAPYTKENVTPTPETGVIQPNGTIYDAGKHCTIEVNEYERYILSCRSRTLPFYAYFIKDINNNTIYTFGDASTTYTDIEITIPENGKYLTLNGDNTNLSAIKLVKSDLNDYINSHFIDNNTKGVIFGDSIIQGVGVLEPNVVPTKDCVTIMQKEMKNTLYNGGVGGTRLSSGNNSFVEIVNSIISDDWTTFNEHLEELIQSKGSKFASLRQQYQRIQALDFSDIDFIGVSYGTNDWTSNRTLDDATNPMNTNTICGALRYCISNLLTTFPNLKVYVFTPTFRYNIGGNPNVNSDTYVNPSSNLTLPQIGDAIEQTCKELHIPCKNMYYVSNTNNYNKEYFMSDGTHRNEEGYKLLGSQYAKFILSN